MLTGKWTCRGYRSQLAFVAADAIARDLILFEAIFDLAQTGPGVIAGAMGMAEGQAFALRGDYAELGKTITRVRLQAHEIDPGTGHGPRYAFTGLHDGAGDDALLIGTMTGADQASAPFVAIRHPSDPPRRTARDLSMLQR